MALLSHRKLENETELGIWEIGEPEEFFLENLALLPAEQSELAAFKGRRRLEWLACRYLVHLMLVDLGKADLEKRIPVLKDEFGKPHLDGTPFHLSFSHSHERVAVLLAKTNAGIDIQAFVPKISTLAHRFMREEELANLQNDSRLEHLHLYWCAKEALYKAYGRKELDFRQHIFIGSFPSNPAQVFFPGKVCKNDFCKEYSIWFERSGEYFLAWCLEVRSEK